MQKITPFLWFDNQAEEAANFYVSIFKNSKILGVSRSGEAGPAVTVSFELDGLAFTALNGGPHFTFTEAISLYVDCESQAEVDDLWAKLTDGGEESMCGWLKDQYGLSWQIVPRVLLELMQDEDPVKAKRVTEAMLQMLNVTHRPLVQHSHPALRLDRCSFHWVADHRHTPTSAQKTKHGCHPGQIQPV